MRKLILLLITITTITNVSYASFPVAESQQTFAEEIIIEEKSQNGGRLYVALSVFSTIVAIASFFLVIGNSLAHNGNSFIYLLLTIASVLATLFFAKGARERGVKKSKSFIGIIVLIISFLLIKFLIFD
ncbi:MAG: hypothetical protein VYD71_00620 [Bacteroidota bacterium]|nr:hypothetical protein [Bacteroidota bacterium]